MWRIAEPYFDYEVSENGEVRNAKTKKLLSQCTTKKGYKECPDCGKKSEVRDD